MATFSEESLVNVYEYINKLANGINPLTNTDIGENSFLCANDSIRTLFSTAQLLQKCIYSDELKTDESNNEFTEKEYMKYVMAFGFNVSRKHISLNEALRKINSLLAPESTEISYKIFIDWIHSLGFLEYGSSGKILQCVPTDAGKKAGIILHNDKNDSSGNTADNAIMLDIRFQQYIADHIASLIEYRDIQQIISQENDTENTEQSSDETHFSKKIFECDVITPAVLERYAPNILISKNNKNTAKTYFNYKGIYKAPKISRKKNKEYITVYNVTDHPEGVTKPFCRAKSVEDLIIKKGGGWEPNLGINAEIVSRRAGKETVAKEIAHMEKEFRRLERRRKRYAKELQRKRIKAVKEEIKRCNELLPIWRLERENRVFDKKRNQKGKNVSSSQSSSQGRRGKEWSEEEEKRLIELYNDGTPIADAARLLSRSEGAVRSRIKTIKKKRNIK